MDGDLDGWEPVAEVVTFWTGGVGSLADVVTFWTGAVGSDGVGCGWVVDRQWLVEAVAEAKVVVEVVVEVV